MNHALALLVAPLALASTAASAVDITATIGSRIGSAFVAEMSDISFASGDSGTYGSGSAFYICADKHDHFPTGRTDTWEITSTLDSLVHPAAATRATDLFNWVVDKYWNASVMANDPNLLGGQFQAVIWELQLDYDGTAASLSTSTGQVNVDAINYNNAPGYPSSYYVQLMSSLQDNYDSIPQGYRSDDFKVSFIQDKTSSNWQSGLMVEALPVPEPASWALMLGGLIAVGALRRRARSER